MKTLSDSVTQSLSDRHGISEAAYLLQIHCKRGLHSCDLRRDEVCGSEKAEALFLSQRPSSTPPTIALEESFPGEHSYSLLRGSPGWSLVKCTNLATAFLLIRHPVSVRSLFKGNSPHPRQPIPS